MLPVHRNDMAFAPAAAGSVNRLEALFDRVFGDDGVTARSWSGAPLAMWEDDDRIYVEAELPGVAGEDLDITVHDGALSIRGERKAEVGRRYLYNGRSYGRFERTVMLPESVDTDGVQATLKDGLLRVELPKSPESKPKKIAIKTC